MSRTEKLHSFVFLTLTRIRPCEALAELGTDIVDARCTVHIIVCCRKAEFLAVVKSGFRYLPVTTHQYAFQTQFGRHFGLRANANNSRRKHTSSGHHSWSRRQGNHLWSLSLYFCRLAGRWRQVLRNLDRTSYRRRLQHEILVDHTHPKVADWPGAGQLIIDVSGRQATHDGSSCAKHKSDTNELHHYKKQRCS